MFRVFYKENDLIQTTVKEENLAAIQEEFGDRLMAVKDPCGNLIYLALPLDYVVLPLEKN